MTNHILSIGHGAVLEARLNRPGSTLLFPTYIGLQRASALLLLGETLDAEAAVAAGLVNAIVPTDELHAYALEKAQALALKPPEAFAVARRLMRGNKTQLHAHMTKEGDEFGRAVRGPEAREAFIRVL
jgi:enoyl-CoA hydratase/carnithine racemase